MAKGLQEVNKARRAPSAKNINGDKSVDSWQGVGLMPSSSETPNKTPSRTVSETPSKTVSETPTETPSKTASGTPTETPNKTVSETSSKTVSETPTETPSKTASGTPTETPSKTASGTPTETPSKTVSETPTETPSKTASGTPTETPNKTVSETPSKTVSETSTETPSKTVSETPNETLTGTASETPASTTHQIGSGRKREGASIKSSSSKHPAERPDDFEIDFELSEQKQSPRYPLLELFVAILDASVPGHVTTKVSHKLISEYFTWTDAKVKKLIQRLTYDHWIAIHSERRGYWIKYEIHSKIVEAVGQEKPIELKKFSKIKQKEGVMRN